MPASSHLFAQVTKKCLPRCSVGRNLKNLVNKCLIFNHCTVCGGIVYSKKTLKLSNVVKKNSRMFRERLLEISTAHML